MPIVIRPRRWAKVSLSGAREELQVGGSKRGVIGQDAQDRTYRLIRRYSERGVLATTALLFTGYLILMVAIVILISARYISQRSMLVIVVTLVLWIIYAGFLSYVGFVADALRRPPGVAYIFLPVALFLVFLSRSKTSARVAVTIPTVVPYYSYFSFVQAPYEMGAEHYKLLEQSVTVPSATTQAIGEAAKQAGMVVSIGVNERDGGTLYNTQLLFDADGTLL